MTHNNLHNTSAFGVSYEPSGSYINGFIIMFIIQQSSVPVILNNVFYQASAAFTYLNGTLQGMI